MKHIWMAVLCGVAAVGWGAAPIATPLGSYGASLQVPVRLAVDAAGNLYVADTDADRVTVFDAFGRVTAVHEGLAGPLGIAVDAAGRIYVGEERTGSVSVFDAQWTLLYRLGAGAGEFQMPNYIAIDPAGGAAYVSDSKANAIKVYSGTKPLGQFGTAGTANGQFLFPAGICIGDGGEVFVVDQGNDRVQVFDLAGTFQRKMKFGGMTGPSGRKQGVRVDHMGRLYVVDAYQSCIKVFDAATGAALGTLGAFGTAAGQLRIPGDLALDALGRLYVTSLNNGRIEVYGLDAFVHLTSSAGKGVVVAGSNMVFTALTGGTGPFAFQWLKNGVAIDGATAATLSLSSVTEADSGAYAVVVNGVTSGVTTASVVVPPSILSGPEGLTELRGAHVRFSVSAGGSAVHYQWQFNGQDIAGATNSALELDNVQAADSGLYCVLVQNAAGNAVSLPASLQVLVPPWVLEILSAGLNTSQQRQITVSSDAGMHYALEASPDMVQWLEVTNFVNDTGLVDVVDAEGAGASQRFYRVRWVP